MGLLVDEKIIVPGPIVNLAAAGAAAAVVIYTIPVALLGAKSVKIHAVNIYNNAAGATQILIGNGVGGAFAALLPALDTFNGLNSAYGPMTDLLQAESFANITAYPVALVGVLGINIQLQVIIVG